MTAAFCLQKAAVFAAFENTRHVCISGKSGFLLNSGDNYITMFFNFQPCAKETADNNVAVDAAAFFANFIKP